MSIRKIFLPVLLFAGFLLIPVLDAAAQTRTIKGTITDDKGQPVAGAQITVTGIDVVRELKSKTDKKGEYTFLLGIAKTRYRVVVRMAGFEPAYKDNVEPELSVDMRVDLALKPGQDYKLPFEMTEQEKADYVKRVEEQKARRQQTEAVRSSVKLGEDLAKEGKYEEAIVEWNKALERLPDEPTLHAAVANAYAKLGKNDQALASYQKAVSLDPKSSELNANLGIFLNSIGKVAEAQEAFKKAAELDPKSAATNFYNLGITMVNSGQAEKGAEAFKQAIAADPNHAESYYQLGMALSGKKDTIPAAIEALKKYVQIGKKPDQVEVAKQIMSALGGK